MQGDRRRRFEFERQTSKSEITDTYARALVTIQCVDGPAAVTVWKVKAAGLSNVRRRGMPRPALLKQLKAILSF
jgi:hypothetical protein